VWFSFACKGVEVVAGRRPKGVLPSGCSAQMRLASLVVRSFCFAFSFVFGFALESNHQGCALANRNPILSLLCRCSVPNK